MSRRERVALVAMGGLIGCRLHFDDLAPADAPAPQTLACNTATSLGAAHGTNLSAAASSTQILAAWIDGTHVVSSGAVMLATDTALATPGLPIDALGGPWDEVSLASNGSSWLAVAHGSSQVARLYDDLRAPLTSSVATPMRPLGPHACAATMGSGPLYALAGYDETSMRNEVVGIRADGTLGNIVDGGTFDVRSTVIPIGVRIGVLGSGATIYCDVKAIDNTVKTFGATVQFGVVSQCGEATAAYTSGRADALLVGRDPVDGDLDVAIATISGSTFTVATKTPVATQPDEPRAVGVAGFYWLTYAQAGQLVAMQVSFAGVAGGQMALGPLADATTHDLVVKGGEPYAIWIDSGTLWLAHLCS